ncbi:MAG: 3-isopropylmalate dehydratase small subunit [Fimbriimonadaceae bacterium]
MAGFTTHTGTIVVYDVDDVDTDRIIPARFLSRVSRSGYGELLFADVRKDGFPLDLPEAKGASVIVVGTNFGCGSSREHAVWAIQQAGFSVVVARVEKDSPGYSDIFRQNAANCGLLLVELAPDSHADLKGAGTGAEATIDLPAQSVQVGGKTHRFEIDPVLKDQLLAGLDLIGATLRMEPEIAAFEGKWDAFAPTRDTDARDEASNP